MDPHNKNKWYDMIYDTIWQMCITGLEETVSFQISPENQHFLTELLFIKWTIQKMDRMMAVFSKDQHSTWYECVMEKNLAFDVPPRCFGQAGPSKGRTCTI